MPQTPPSLARAAQGRQEEGLSEGKAQCISREQDAIPRGGLDQIERIERCHLSNRSFRARSILLATLPAQECNDTLQDRSKCRLPIGVDSIYELVGTHGDKDQSIFSMPVDVVLGTSPQFSLVRHQTYDARGLTMSLADSRKPAAEAASAVYDTPDNEAFLLDPRWECSQ